MSNISGNVEEFCPEACPFGQFMEGFKCLPCPSGAFCPEASDRTTVRALAGFWRIPNQLVFVKCLHPCSCLGAVNGHNTCQNRTVANVANPEGCNIAQGFRPGSRLCADCLPGYSRDGRGGCKKCGEKKTSIMLTVAVAVGIVCCLCFLVYSSVVKRKGQFGNSDGAKKIFISYLQLAGLATTMKIPWPTNYVALFRTKSMLASVGEELLNIRCAIGAEEGGLSIAALEYYKTLAYAAVPGVLVACSTLCWHACGRSFPRSERRAMMTGTIVLLLYLAYPSISAVVLGLWKCEYMEGLGSIFVADPEVLCTDDVHKRWQFMLGLPCLLVYVLGLPVSALVLLYRYRSKLSEPRTRIRFGQLYDGFTRENYLYEGWVTLRKLLIIVVGIFSNKLQVLLAIGAVVLLLTHTVLKQPYTAKELTQLDILLLSCCFLTYWMGGVFVVYPHCQSSENEAGICKFGEIVILAVNILCLIVGVGTYARFLWAEKGTKLNKLCRLFSKRFFHKNNNPEAEKLNVSLELDDITKSKFQSEPPTTKEVEQLRTTNLKLEKEICRLRKIIKMHEDETEMIP